MANATAHDVESLVFKTLDLIRKIEPLKDSFDRSYTPIESALKKYEDVVKGDLLATDNEDINKMWALAKLWKSQLNKIANKDENYWMEMSGVNVFVRSTIQTAINKLKEVLTNLINMKESSKVCATMITVLNVNDHMDIKGWSSMMVSTKWLDIEGRKKARQEFIDCSEMISGIEKRLNISINCLQRHLSN
jgi:hypothetical protein